MEPLARKTFQERVLQARDIIEKILLTREGQIITPEVARERANNAGQALQLVLEDVWQDGYNAGHMRMGI